MSSRCGVGDGGVGGNDDGGGDGVSGGNIFNNKPDKRRTYAEIKKKRS